MIKNSFSLVILQEKRKKKMVDPLNFKYSVSPIRYEDLLHIWNLYKKDYLSHRGLWKILGKRQRLLSYLWILLAWMIWPIMNWLWNHVNENFTKNSQEILKKFINLYMNVHLVRVDQHNIPLS